MPAPEPSRRRWSLSPSAKARARARFASEVAAGRMVIPANKVHLAGRLEPMCIGIAATLQGERQHRQLGRHERHRRRAREAAHGGPLRRRHGDGPVDRQEHRRDPQGDHRRLAGADRHGADLPDARRARRRHRRHAAAAFSRHGRAPGEAGRRLHDDPLRRDARASAPDDGPRDGHRQPRRLADRQVDDGPPQAEPALHALRRSVRHHAAVRRHLEPGRRLAARLDRRRQRRGPVRRARRAGRADRDAAGNAARR